MSNIDLHTHVIPPTLIEDLRMPSCGPLRSVGAAPHFAMETLNAMTGMKMVHVPYKGGGPA